jgi:XTP/dITP diphosphohydrolase
LPNAASPTCDAQEAELATEIFEGTCEGTILEAPRTGPGGFGYDPLFVPEGFDKSFAELGDKAKNQISHRARAIKKLEVRLLRRNPLPE